MAAGEGVAQAAAVDQIAARAHSHAAEELEAALAAEEEEEAARRLPLYLALCNRSPDMLAALLAGFDGASAAAQATVQELLPGLLLHLPMEAVTEVLLAQLRGEPDASPPLSAASPLPLLALHVLADRATAEGGTVPAALTAGVLGLVSRLGPHGGAYAVPLLPFLDESQAVAVLPALLRLDKGDLTEALAALAHAEPPPLAPRALLLQLHLLKPEDGERGVPLKALIDAIQACINEREVFTRAELTAALEEVVQLDPLPLLTMRTIIQTMVNWPDAATAVMGLLRTLLKREVWATKLWGGYVRCCTMAMPLSRELFYAMPPAQLEAALASHPDVKQKLVAHARAERGAVPTAALGVLGL